MGCRRAFKRWAKRVRDESTPHLRKFAGQTVALLEKAILGRVLQPDDARKIGIGALREEAKQNGVELSTAVAGTLIDVAHEEVNKLGKPVDNFAVDDTDEPENLAEVIT